MATQTQIRLALIEDSAQFVQVIERLVANIPGAILLGTVDDATRGIELVRRTDPDILLLDLHLRQSTGMQVLEEIADQTDRIAVIVVTNQPSTALQQRCLKLGARAFLDKTTQLEELVGLLTGHQLLHKVNN